MRAEFVDFELLWLFVFKVAGEGCWVDEPGGAGRATGFWGGKGVDSPPPRVAPPMGGDRFGVGGGNWDWVLFPPPLLGGGGEGDAGGGVDGVSLSGGDGGGDEGGVSEGGGGDGGDSLDGDWSGDGDESPSDILDHPKNENPNDKDNFVLSFIGGEGVLTNKNIYFPSD